MVPKKDSGVETVFREGFGNTGKVLSADKNSPGQLVRLGDKSRDEQWDGRRLGQIENTLK